MTLTTEQLRARAAAYRRDAETLAELGDTASSQRLNESANAFDELAATREAQPVEYGDAYQGAREDLSIWKRRALEAEDKMRHLEKINDHLVKEAQGEHRMGEPILTAPPAPAVPEEITEDEQEESVSDGYADSFRGGWNACRAAMLENIGKPAPQLDSVVTRHADKPVSGGYKLQDDTQRMDWLVAHHVTVRKPLRYGSEAMFTAQTITDEEDDYHATKLREQIDAAMLAAAPESGNDHDTRR
ncbi:TPA: hypothetical protein ACX37U_000614 [Serratia marcescens]